MKQRYKLLLQTENGKTTIGRSKWYVRPSVCMSVRDVDVLWPTGHVSWVSSKVITRLISLVSSLLGSPTSAICGLDGGFDSADGMLSSRK